MCGVYGVHSSKQNVSPLIIEGLSRSQHRGQESAGIAISHEENFRYHRELGLVSHAAEEGNWIALPGRTGIGHNRYSTKGSTTLENAGPIKVPSPIGPIAVSYNGNLVNTNQLRAFLSSKGMNFKTTTDTEVIAQCLVYHLHRDLPIMDALAEMMKDLHGGYALAILTTKGLYAVRDPHGIRPLVLGQMEDGYVVCSETCALLDAEFVREIERGEILEITDNGLNSRIVMQLDLALCIFELIYFARPDSIFLGETVQIFRKKTGLELAKEEIGDFVRLPNSIVVPMPTTADTAAASWGWHMQVPVEKAIIKDRYTARTFIMPMQEMRNSGVRKFSIVRAMVEGYSINLLDDSIVRGTTKREMVNRLLRKGAQEVHGHVTSPPYKFSCLYGIDTAERQKLIAATRTIDEIRHSLGLNSLHYLSLDGLYRSTSIPRCNFCDACFSGNYPVEPLDAAAMAKNSLES